MGCHLPLVLDIYARSGSDESLSTGILCRCSTTRSLCTALLCCDPTHLCVDRDLECAAWRVRPRISSIRFSGAPDDGIPIPTRRVWPARLGISFHLEDPRTAQQQAFADAERFRKRVRWPCGRCESRRKTQMTSDLLVDHANFKRSLYAHKSTT